MAIADKLQKLVDGKQYVIDKVNAKANSDLKINSTWESIGDTVEGIQSGGEAERSLKKLLDTTKKCNDLFSGVSTMTDASNILQYSDTSNVTDMHYMFSNCSALTTMPLLDTSNVTNMGGMFKGCTVLTSVPLLDTSNVNDMSYMLNNCISLTLVPQFDTDNVTNMEGMFFDCNSITTIPLLNTSNVTNMRNMFSDCDALTSIPQLNTSNVNDMSYMFSNCDVLTTIPLLDTSNVTNMGGMFEHCYMLTIIPQLNTSNVTDMRNMFNKATSLTTTPLLDTGKVTEMRNMFSNCYMLNKIDITHYNLSTTSNSSYWCRAGYSLKAVIIRSFGTSYALNSSAFQNCDHILGTVDETYNPEGLKDGYIYVPRSMVDTLKSTTNWSRYADQIRALEDYTVDGTTTGELDESKVNA